MQLKKKIKYITSIIIFLTLFSNLAISQTDSISDINVKKEKIKKPAIAITLSTILPGAGQIYNGKWYKVPFIYLALGTSYYFVKHYSVQYNLYRTDLINLSLDSNYQPVTQITDLTQLAQKYNQFRRSRDIAFLGGVLVWSLNIIDAYVDAELSNFDVSPDLTLHIYPKVYSFENKNTYAVTFSLKF